MQKEVPELFKELGMTNDDMKSAISYAKTIQEFVMKIFKIGIC